jgi:hypothetical protein
MPAWDTTLKFNFEGFRWPRLTENNSNGPRSWRRFTGLALCRSLWVVTVLGWGLGETW